MTKQLDGMDHHVEMLRGRTDVSFCPNCETALDRYAAGFKKKVKPKYDVTCLSQGLTAVSPRFRQFLEENSPSDVVYHPLPSGCFIIEPVRKVYLDLAKLGPHIEGYCSRCGRPRSCVASALSDSERIQLIPGQDPISEFDIVCSVQEFGQPGSMHPLELVGDKLGGKILEADFSGACVR